MSRFLEELNKRVLVVDGAMGTQLMERGVKPEDCFDAQNITKPKIVEDIHRAYIKAGADIIETNTFGANRIKLSDYQLEKKVREINVAAAQITRRAAGAKNFVCGSIGPLGQMLEPVGEVTFDQAYEAFAEQAKALEEGGADVISVETISDLQEMRAAVIAVKNETKLPVIASMTYDENGLTTYGTPPEAAVVVLEAIGADVMSANCSTGPEGLLKVAKRLLEVTKVPVMVMPNAGMPELEGGCAVYHMTPKQFGDFAGKFAKLGVRIIGGCCGTAPQHIAAVKSKLQTSNFKINPKPQIQNPKTRFASRTKMVEIKAGIPMLVGERINPTGRKLFQAEIASGKTQTIRTEALEQTKAGANLLDVNISMPEISESQVMASAVGLVQSVSNLPLSIDSPNRFALEAGLKQFCGRALLNSVNGKKESLDGILPLAKKYGAAIIALTFDEQGIPKNAEGKFAVAEKIVRSALQAGIAKEDIFVDCLVMTAGVGIADCLETLKAVEQVKQQLGVKTILGLSNVSHGMPGRSKLNALYFQLALNYGLDAAIIDVTDPEIRKALKGVRGEGRGTREELLKAFRAEVDTARRSGKPAEKKREAAVKEIKFSSYLDIKKAVIAGDSEAVKILVNQALEKKYAAQKIIDQGLLPGMEVVGKKFSQKHYYLPQVIESAEAMAIGFALCKARIPAGQTKKMGKVLLATVKGDIHDIGKNIVKMMLDNHGFEVIDLGKDVPTEKIIEVAKKEKPNVIALSALITTTMVEMGVVKEALIKVGLHIPVLVGGAVVTKGYADKIGAEYSVDAVGAVGLAKRIMKISKGKRK